MRMGCLPNFEELITSLGGMSRAAQWQDLMVSHAASGHPRAIRQEREEMVAWVEAAFQFVLNRMVPLDPPFGDVFCRCLRRTSTLHPGLRFALGMGEDERVRARDELTRVCRMLLQFQAALCALRVPAPEGMVREWRIVYVAVKLHMMREWMHDFRDGAGGVEGAAHAADLQLWTESRIVYWRNLPQYLGMSGHRRWPVALGIRGSREEILLDYMQDIEWPAGARNDLFSLGLI